jgi:hypothetical protein
MLLGARFATTMETATHANPEERSPQRAWGLGISRKRAFLTHLGVSTAIVSAACAVIFLLWYPHPYFQAVGAWNVLRVLIGVDLVLGPLLTLVVFKPGKPGLRFDLTVIALVQVAALIYGLTTIYRERPYFTVFAHDRFVVLAKGEVDAAQFEAAKTAGRLDDKPFRGPLLAVATRPRDDQEFQKLLDETVFGGKPDLERRPEFWSRYEDEAAQILHRELPLAALRAARPEADAQIAALTARLGVPEARLGFLPMIAKNRDVTLVVDATTAAPLEVLDVDPWIEGTVPPAPPATQPPASN